MKKLEIKSPCDKDWSKMTGDDKVRFCASCEHEVIDFTEKPVAEILEILENKKDRTCGRLTKSQLNPVRKIAAAVMIGGMLAGSCAPDLDNTHLGKVSITQTVDTERGKILVKVKGIVILEDGEKAAGALVGIRRVSEPSLTSLSLKTNDDGSFEYEKEINLTDLANFEFVIHQEGYRTYETPLGEVNAESNLVVSLEAEIKHLETKDGSFVIPEDCINVLTGIIGYHPEEEFMGDIEATELHGTKPYFPENISPIDGHE